MNATKMLHTTKIKTKNKPTHQQCPLFRTDNDTKWAMYVRRGSWRDTQA